MSADLRSLDVPRHVHRPNGESRIVATHDDLETAVREGWFVDPNNMTEPERAPLFPAAVPTRGPGRPRKP